MLHFAVTKAHASTWYAAMHGSACSGLPVTVEGFLVIDLDDIVCAINCKDESAL